MWAGDLKNRVCKQVLLLTCVCLSIANTSLADEESENASNSKQPRVFSPLHKLQWRPSEYFQSLDAQKAAAAISEGSGDRLRAIHANGFNWNTQGRDGVTLLLWSLLADKIEIYEQLLKWGADPDLPLRTEKDLRIFADFRPFRHGDSVTIIVASVPSKTNWLSLAIAHGGDPNALVGAANDTVFTAYLDHPQPTGAERFSTIDLMIQKGANIHHINRYGESALFKSFFANDFDIVNKLLMLGVRPECYDRRDWLLVHHVAALENERRQDNEKYPLKKQEWLDSPQRKDFERLVGLLAERGFPLEEAIADVKRANESVDGIPYMTWRRMQRQDKDACTEAPAPNGAAPQNDAPKKQATPKDR